MHLCASAVYRCPASVGVFVPVVPMNGPIYSTCLVIVKELILSGACGLIGKHVVLITGSVVNDALPYKVPRLSEKIIGAVTVINYTKGSVVKVIFRRSRIRVVFISDVLVPKEQDAGLKMVNVLSSIFRLTHLPNYRYPSVLDLETSHEIRAQSVLRWCLKL